MNWLDIYKYSRIKSVLGQDVPKQINDQVSSQDLEHIVNTVFGYASQQLREEKGTDLAFDTIVAQEGGKPIDFELLDGVIVNLANSVLVSYNKETNEEVDQDKIVMSIWETIKKVDPKQVDDLKDVDVSLWEAYLEHV